MAERRDNQSECDSNYRCLTLCIEHYCYLFCKKFLEAGFDSSECDDAFVYMRILGNIIGPVFGRENWKKSSYFLRTESIVVLTLFCYKVWSKDLETDDNLGQLKSLSDYIDYLFAFLSRENNATDENEYDRKKNYMLKALHSQMILDKSRKSKNREELVSLFDEWNKDNLILYPEEVKNAITNSHSEIPDFLEYASFLLTMKRLVQDVFENFEEPFLTRIETALNAAESAGEGTSLGDASVTFNEVLDREIKNLKEKGNSTTDRIGMAAVESEADELQAQEDMSEKAELGRIDQDDEVVTEDSTLNDVPNDVCTNVRSSRQRRKFSKSEETWLRKGIRRFGVGKWKEILESYPFRGRTTVNLKDKYRNMMTKMT